MRSQGSSPRYERRRASLTVRQYGFPEAEQWLLFDKKVAAKAYGLKGTRSDPGGSITVYDHQLVNNEDIRTRFGSKTAIQRMIIIITDEMNPNRKDLIKAHCKGLQSLTELVPEGAAKVHATSRMPIKDEHGYDYQSQPKQTGHLEPFIQKIFDSITMDGTKIIVQLQCVDGRDAGRRPCQRGDGSWP